ncbi:MAG: DUF1223 domain-containing protein [Pseudomonadota bacterium]
MTSRRRGRLDENTEAGSAQKTHHLHHPRDASRALSEKFEDGAVTIPAGGDGGTVWLAAYDDVNEVAIDRGENAGKTLTYHKSVRELTELGRYDGGAMTAGLPLERLAADGRDGAAVLLQADDGAIIGAARVPLSSAES